MDTKAKVVAYGLWHESDQRLGNFVHNDINTATYEASQAAIYGYTLMPLVKLTDHESALAELREELQKQKSLNAGYQSTIAMIEVKLTTLLTGLEALAVRMDKRDQWMRTMLAPNIGLADAFKNAAEDIRSTVASAGLEGNGNGR